MLGSLKQRAWGRLHAALGHLDADSDRVLHALAGVQQLRVWTEELEGGVLHLLALPSRQDVRRLHRRVTALRSRVSELERALAQLEGEDRDG